MMKMTRTDFFKFVVDIFLPNRCAVCSKVIRWDREMCRSCAEKIERVADSVCPVCAKKQCLDHASLRFDRTVCLYSYEEPCITGIYQLKFARTVSFAKHSAGELAKVLEKRGLAQQIDVVTCVPMSRRKKRKRGHNHAEVIANYLAKQLGKPLDVSLLVHSNTMTDHHKLLGSERAENARNSFAIAEKHGDISGKTVLLCDDVYTTGATMNACADCLKRLGAKSVIAAAIATTQRERKRESQQI